MYHENYVYYKEAIDTAWKTLINCKVSSLPLNIAIIAKLNNIAILKYSESKNKNLTGDGFSFSVNGRCMIYYNDKNPNNRIRFTIAHEIGHCLLGHLKENQITPRINNETDNYTDVKEIQANNICERFVDASDCSTQFKYQFTRADIKNM